LEFSIKGLQPALGKGGKGGKSGCAIVGVYESRKLDQPGAALDKLAKGYLADLAKRGDIEGKSGSTLLLHNVPGVSAERVLLVGLGREGDFGPRQYREAVAAAMRALSATGAKDAELYLTAIDMDKHDIEWRVRQAVAIAAESLYRFDAMKSSRDNSKRALQRLTLGVADKGDTRKAERGLAQGSALAAGMALTKDLGNLPPNVCTPSFLGDQAVKLGKQYKMKVQVLDREDMQKLGMNTLLAVAAGSHEPPKFIVMEHRGGGKNAKPVVLVGKGITFDTGGISIKPSGEMDEMKFDMSGAGSVLGTMKAVGELSLPLNVVGLIPTTENMPGGRAARPGDIVKSMSGQTVEILNTDAEGRLILCDALTYAERYQPAAVIDIATLTGAMVIALGHVATGLFANDDGLAEEVLAAADSAHDRAWRMPLWDDYQDQLKSNFADFANIGGRPGGSITAACFLSRFTRKYKWAHLDIAGTAWRGGKEKGATARPVPLLLQFLLSRARGS
jgi:leucyl aminopeptidase